VIVIRHGQAEFNRIAREAWSDITLVTHWAFIKAVTGLDVPNEAALQIDPP
jgi:broad specificity phosphatase PhoE